MRYITPFLLSIKNLKKRPFRTLVGIFGVLVASGTLFAGSLLMKSVESGISTGMERLGADIMVVPREYGAQAKTALLGIEPSVFYMPGHIAEKVSGIEGVESVSAQLFVVSANLCCDIGDTRIIGFDPVTDFIITPWLKDKGIRNIKHDEVITGSELTFYPGEEIQLYGKKYTVRATLEDSTGIPFFDNSIYMPFEGAYRMIEDSKGKKKVTPINIVPDSISVVLVRLKPEAYAQRVGILIESEIENVKAIVAEDVITSFRKQLSMTLKAIFTLSGIIWITVILMIGAGFSMMVNERKREIGLLRAMGASKGYIFREIMYEASLETLLGGVLGVFAGGILTFVFKNLIVQSMKLPYLWPSLEFAGLLAISCIGLSLLSGAISALLPAIRSSKLDPYDAIRGGE